MERGFYINWDAGTIVTDKRAVKRYYNKLKKGIG